KHPKSLNSRASVRLCRLEGDVLRMHLRGGAYGVAVPLLGLWGCTQASAPDPVATATKIQVQMEEDGQGESSRLVAGQQLQGDTPEQLLLKLLEQLTQQSAALKTPSSETPPAVSTPEFAQILQIATDGQNAKTSPTLAWTEIFTQLEIGAEREVSQRIQAEDTGFNQVFYLLSGCNDAVQWQKPLQLHFMTGRLQGQVAADFQECSGTLVAIAGGAAIQAPFTLLRRSAEEDAPPELQLSWDKDHGDLKVLMGADFQVTASVDMELGLGEKINYSLAAADSEQDCQRSEAVRSLALDASTGVLAGTASVTTPGVCKLAVVASLGEQATATSFTIQVAPGEHQRVLRFSKATVVAEQHVQVKLAEGFETAKVQRGGKDLRFLTLDGHSLDFWVEDWDNLDGESYIWVKVPQEGTETILLYYGNPALAAASDLKKTFTYRDEVELYVTMGHGEPQNLALASYLGQNAFSVETGVGRIHSELSFGTVVTVPGVTQSLIMARGPLAGRQLDHKHAYETIAPLSQAGTLFGYPRSRGLDQWQVYNPNDHEAELTITGFTKKGVDELEDFVDVIPPHSFKSIERDVKRFGLVRSDIPVLVFYTADQGTKDGVLLPQAAKRLFGVSGGTTHVGVVVSETNLTVYYSDGTMKTFENLEKGQNFALTGAGRQGDGLALYIDSDQPVVAVSQADQDGTESVPFWGERALAREYIVPTESEYLAVATLYQNQVVTVVDPGSVHGSETKTSTFAGGSHVGKLRFGEESSTKYAPGTRVFSDYPFYLYYEYAAQDETVAVSYHHARQYTGTLIEVEVGEEQ
ncbi:MAG: DUF2341 domain-containing protein, partial [Zetaproteobacteria bacterium]|nr:DUF2341 domain-containing protein [Zetaproteobacteria bacterium]